MQPSTQNFHDDTQENIYEANRKAILSLRRIKVGPWLVLEIAARFKKDGRGPTSPRIIRKHLNGLREDEEASYHARSWYLSPRPPLRAFFSFPEIKKHKDWVFSPPMVGDLDGTVFSARETDLDLWAATTEAGLKTSDLKSLKELVYSRLVRIGKAPRSGIFVFRFEPPPRVEEE